MGHVNNAVYLTYLEQARFFHWRASGLVELARGSEAGAAGAAPDTDDVPADVPGVILARVEIDYRRPAKYGDRLRIDVAIAAVGRTSFTYEYEIRAAAGQLVASARTVIVRFDYALGRPVAISDALKQALTRSLLA